MVANVRPPPGVPAAPNQVTANRTIYVRNLPDRIPKEDLKRNLYMLFATYGVVLDIVALKTMKMRGQAHIVFRDVESATQAMRALQGFTFFGKDMTIAYAKTKSHAISKLDGSFELPKKEVPEKKVEQTSAQTTTFGAAPAKAVPVNEQDQAKGQKRAREEEESDDDAEMEMEVSDSDDD